MFRIGMNSLQNRGSFVYRLIMRTSYLYNKRNVPFLEYLSNSHRNFNMNLKLKSDNLEILKESNIQSNDISDQQPYQQETPLESLPSYKIERRKEEIKYYIHNCKEVSLLLQFYIENHHEFSIPFMKMFLHYLTRLLREK